MAQHFDFNRITEMAEQISQESKNLETGGDKARAILRQKAEKLLVSLEAPQETMIRMWLLEATTKSTLRVAFDLKLFELLPGAQDGATTTAELAEKTGADPQLLARILNHLAAAGIIGEAGPDHYQATALTLALTTQKARDSFDYFNYMFQPLLAALPKFLSDRKWQDPKHSTDSPFQLAFNTKLTSWEYIKSDPELGRLFHSAVLSQDFARRAHWEDPEFYPVQERLISGAKDGGVVLVDVGGGAGLDTIKFLEAYPEAKLVLEDTPEVIGTLNEFPPQIEKLSHDFFKEQPIKGARAYYFHRVFHDWADEESRQILLALKPAMTPGYSKLLIQDHVIPAQDASWLGTASDLLMMCGFSGRERRESDFRALLESVGMVVMGIWTRVPGEESVVEAIVPE